MKTKILIPLFTLSCLLVTSATAQVNYAVSRSTAYVTNSPNASGNIVIASTYNGYPVTSITSNAFYGVNTMTSVTIPNSVTNISDYAFVYCWGLTNVAIGSSVATIGDYAFYYCSGLTSVAIPASVITVGRGAFSDCSGMTTVTISDSVTTIGNNAFFACSSLTNFTVGPANPSYASAGGVLFNKALTTLVQYPQGLAGSYAIPNSVTTIGNSAFNSCSGLTSATIPNSVTNIGIAAFVGCYLLTNVTIPDSVTTIGNGAFVYCSGLTSVTIPQGVTNLGIGVFNSCYSLTNIAVEVANPSYASAGGVLFNKTQSLLIQYPAGLTNSSYVIPNSVSSIGSSAFRESWLTSVTIPNGCTTIGDAAFYFCISLTNLTIPNSVTNIGQYAFYYCQFLTSVTIPSSVTSVGDGAFTDCVSLEAAYFQGNAPSVDGQPGSADNTVFSSETGTAYYLPGTTGWGATFGGWPTVLWNPQATNFSFSGGHFGFRITGPTNATIVVEACTNLSNPVWLPVSTNALIGGASSFSDPQSINYPSRFYRFRSQ